MTKLRLGIDVGGTNTDAAILNDKNEIIHTVKYPTSLDVTSGIVNAIGKIIHESEIDIAEIDYPMLGTTHCTNAIVERKGLNEIAVIRIGAPATTAVMPLTGAPADLKDLLNKHAYLIGGGHEFNGELINELDEDKLREIAEDIKGSVDSVAITSVFSPVKNDHELRAKEIIQSILGDEIHISLSHQIGSTGLLERENATILNSAVVNVAEKTANGFKDALTHYGINPTEVFFSQNDGTLMSIDYTIQYPILTVACGPTNSLRGASFLGEVRNAVTVDVGGTTSDLGVLHNGFPRESAIAVEVGGMRTNFRMPDVTSIGLGGGTIIRQVGDEVTIGPDSVGYRITEKALVFGGDTLTATDVAVAKGICEVGDPEKVSHLGANFVDQAYAMMVEMLENSIYQIKTSAEPGPVILVGVGSVIFPEEIKGAERVIKHPQGPAANAIGATIAEVSGQVEKIYSLDEYTRDEILDQAKEEAIREAVKAGADPQKIEIVNLEDVPLAYLGNATNVKVKASGPLK